MLKALQNYFFVYAGIGLVLFIRFIILAMNEKPSACIDCGTPGGWPFVLWLILSPIVLIPLVIIKGLANRKSQQQKTDVLAK